MNIVDGEETLPPAKKEKGRLMKMTFSENMFEDAIGLDDHDDFADAVRETVNNIIVSSAKQKANEVSDRFWEKMYCFKEEKDSFEDKYGVTIPKIDDEGYWDEFSARAWLDIFGETMDEIFPLFYADAHYSEELDELMRDIKQAFGIRFGSDAEQKFEYYIMSYTGWEEVCIYHMKDERLHEGIRTKNDDIFGEYNPYFGFYCGPKMKFFADGKFSAYDFFGTCNLMEMKYND